MSYRIIKHSQLSGINFLLHISLLNYKNKLNSIYIDIIINLIYILDI